MLLLRVCSAQYEGTRTGQLEPEPPGAKVQQEPQGTAEDREPAALIPGVQSAARRMLGLLRQGNNHANDQGHWKVFEADKKAYFAAHPDKKPKEQRIADWKAKGGNGGKGQGKGQGKGGGRGYGGGPGQDQRLRSIEEAAEDMLRTLGELKAQQRGGRSHGGSQQEGAAAGQV